MRFLSQSRLRLAIPLSARPLHSAPELSLRTAIERLVPVKREQLKRVRDNLGERVLGDVKVANIIGGMRGLKAMLWESSVLDPDKGIRFHGHSIPDCQVSLPPVPGGKEMIPESMLWLLLTGEIPTADQVRELSQYLAERGDVPEFVEKLVDSFPKTLHPMTQLAIGVAALNHDSSFAAAYEDGLPKSALWQPAFDDALRLIAKLPRLAARIYSNLYRDSTPLPPIDPTLDLIGNFSQMIGFGGNESVTEYLRLYIALHGDHEGGNVSAHTAHLVGSALADPFLAYSSALMGLAGPLHGLANQEVLRFILSMQGTVGQEPRDDQISNHLWATLKSGQVIPGYGHGVLRSPDPRFVAIQQFCERFPKLQASPIIKIVQQMSKIAPVVLLEHGKSKNPHPNVDAISGCVLYHYGLTQFKYYTVIFGLSRALGCMTQYIWDRALGLPIERPKSLSLKTIEDTFRQ